jgi:hypothetical protein
MTDRISKILKGKPARLLLFSLLLSLVFTPYLSVHVQAEPSPINLVLGSQGITPWNVSNIQPGDNGTKTVSLHNISAADGTVNIWISNLVSINGTVPVKLAGSTARLSDYLKLDLFCPGLQTNITLPCSLSDLPMAVSGSRYVMINPLKAGETVSLIWKWELPAGTGNEIQGKGASFDINYTLVQTSEPPPQIVETENAPPGNTPTTTPESPSTRPVLSVDLMGSTNSIEMDARGNLQKPVKLSDPAGDFVFEMDSGSRITSSDGTPITRIEIIQSEERIPKPGNVVQLSQEYSVIGYIGNTQLATIRFDPSAVLTLHYDPKSLPENAFPPYIAVYTPDASWTRLEKPAGSVFEVGTVEGIIYHASTYAVFAEIAPPAPLPAEFIVGNLLISPLSVPQDKPVTVTVTVENKGALKGNYELYLTIDGVVQGAQSISLNASSRQTITFTVSNLAPGLHRVNVAGQTGEFQVVAVSNTAPIQPRISWGMVELIVAAVIGILLIVFFVIIRKSRTPGQSGINLSNIMNVLKGRNRD